MVKIRYTGSLHRGAVFRSDDIVDFAIGERQVVAGLEHDVEGMRVGGRREFVVPPHLACRHIGLPGVIPPDALLPFNVELLEVS